MSYYPVDVTDCSIGKELTSVVIHIDSIGAVSSLNSEMLLRRNSPAVVLELSDWRTFEGIPGIRGRYVVTFLERLSAALFTWVEILIEPGEYRQVYKVATNLRGDWVYDPETKEVWSWGRDGRRRESTKTHKVRLLTAEAGAAS